MAQFIDFKKIQRVLVIKLRHHGDVLLSSPVFACLKNHYPQLDIDALIYRDTQDMLLDHPSISQVQLIDRAWKKLSLYQQAQAEWQLLQTLRQRQYQLIIHLTEHWRGAWLCRLLKPQYAITGKYPHRKNWLWRSSFSHHYPLVAKRHTVEKQLDALRHLGLSPQANDLPLVIEPGAAAQDSISEKLNQAGIKDKPYLLIHPTSRWLFKTWPIELMVQLIDQLQAQGQQIILTAAPDKKELAMIEQITQQLSQPVINFAGQLRLKELAVLINRASCFIGMDSVPMHLAAACQTPVVALFGPSGELEWGPWQAPHRVLTSKHSCRPCGFDGCGGGKISDCLAVISVNQVLTAIDQLLAQGCMLKPNRKK